MPDETSSTAPAPIPKLKSFEELLGLVSEAKTFQFEFGGKLVEIGIRPLTTAEWSKVNEIGADLKPPAKLDDKKKIIPGEYDKDDPKYLQEAVRFFKLRRVSAFGLALEGIAIPGESIEQKVNWVETSLPPGLVDMLWAAICSLTSDPIQLAHFTTVAR